MAEEKESTNKSLFEQLLKAGKDVTAIMRDLILLVLGLLILLYPDVINNRLVKAGFVKGNLLGFEWKSQFEKTDDQLKEANFTITNLRKQLEQNANILKDVKPNIKNHDLKVRIEETEGKTKKLTLFTAPLNDKLKNTIDANADLVKGSPDYIKDDPAKWGVVFGGDISLSATKDEIRNATSRGLRNLKVFYRQNSYRSVALADSRQHAEKILNTARLIRRDAYVVDINHWCPQKSERADYIECGSSARYVLRNRSTGSTLVVSVPNIEAVTDNAKHVCLAMAGTPITLMGETAKMFNIDMWQKIKITDGPCADKIGWVAVENISYE